jgi:hypothetical protein
MSTLSQSAIKCWDTCPAKYYAQYVLGVNLGQGDVHMDWGTAFHKEVESYHLGTRYNEELISSYVAQYPRLDGDAVEVGFEFTPRLPATDEALPVTLTGIIDRLSWNEIRDLKTSSVSWSQRRADEDIQATLYCYFIWQELGELLPFTFMIYRKDWKPTSRFSQIQEVTTTRTVEDFKSFWLMTNKVILDIQSESVFPCTCRNEEHKIWSNV